MSLTSTTSGLAVCTDYESEVYVFESRDCEKERWNGKIYAIDCEMVRDTTSPPSFF